jgi:ubiquinone/menaquinone biosynthesis C-methylase UbiE
MSTHSQPTDSWQSGYAYEQYMGRWSQLIAYEFLHWLPIAEGMEWLDAGCGTGVLSRAILDTKQPKAILAIDSSPHFIAFAQETNKDPRLHVAVALAQSLPAELNHFDAVVSGLVLNFVPQPEQAVAEMKRVAKPGGVVAAYLWDYADGMQMLRFFWDAAVTLDKNAAQLHEGTRFPLCQKGKLETLFLDSGLQDVRFRSIEIATVFNTFEDYWRPFLSGVGPAPSYMMTLNESQRIALKERLRATLPEAAGGTISLVARAWAVQGTA